MTLQSPEAQSTPIFSRRDVAVRLINIVKGLMKRHGRTHRPYVSPVPKKVHDRFISMLVSPLLNRKREDIGEVRVWIQVPEYDILPIRLIVEWTRHAFGFWYRDESKIENIEDPTDSFLKALDKSIRSVKITADGTVRLASMNRGGVKKIKQNRVKDKAARSGLMMG